MENSSKMGRREFLAKTALGAAALGVGMGQGPADGRVLGANERIHIGVIGCGGMGTHHLQRLYDMSKDPRNLLRVTAVCDVYEPRKERARAVTEGKAKVFHYYWEMLERGRLDAVVIATPDHWHSKISIDAMEAGLDVYCEKPMTLYWHEAKQVHQTVERTGRVFQCGAQGCSDDAFWQAKKLIQQGTLGKLIWSQWGAFRNVPGGDWNYGIDWSADPKTNLDWDLWLGPAPKRPFEHDRFFNFRKFWDYSGGLATDLLYHSLSNLQIALGGEFPRRVVANGGIYIHHDREVPDTFHVIIDYPTDHSVVLLATGANEQGLPPVIRGEHATLYFEGPGVVVRPEAPYAEGKEVLEVPREPRADHMNNFLECVRTRKKPHLDSRTAYATMVAIALSVAAYREGKTKVFDPVREEVVR